MKTLEEVIKDKAKLTSTFEELGFYSHPGFHLNFYFTIYFKTYAYFKDILFNDSKELYDSLKPFIYYLYSLTYNIKFLRGRNLLMAKICFSYSNEKNEFNHDFDISFLGVHRIREFNKNLIKNYDEELVNKGHFFIGSISKLSIQIGTFYYGNDRNDYLQIGRELEENGERVNFFFLTTFLQEKSRKVKKKKKKKKL